MAFKVRTCKSLAEFKQALGADRRILRLGLDERSRSASSACYPLDHMHAAFDGKRAVGGAGAFPFDMSVPGGSVRARGSPSSASIRRTGGRGSSRR